MKKNNNIFIRQIYDKRKTFFLIRWIKYKKFLKLIDKSTPTFSILWQIADFVKVLENVYMYDNSSTNTLYSSSNFDYGENGFIVRKENYVIKTKLYDSTGEIAIEISRSGSKNVQTMKFIDGKPWNEDRENYIELLIFVQNTIMNSVKELFIKYYKMR